MGLLLALAPTRISLPRYPRRVGLHIGCFEACSAFTHVAACTLALPPYFVTRLPEGFSHFVTSMTAPVASGWSRGRVGLAPTGKAPPLHGARRKRTSQADTETPDAARNEMRRWWLAADGERPKASKSP